jgi:hypothetical protein
MPSPWTSRIEFTRSVLTSCMVFISNRYHPTTQLRDGLTTRFTAVRLHGHPSRDCGIQQRAKRMQQLSFTGDAPTRLNITIIGTSHLIRVYGFQRSGNGSSLRRCHRRASAVTSSTKCRWNPSVSVCYQGLQAKTQLCPTVYKAGKEVSPAAPHTPGPSPQRLTWSHRGRCIHADIGGVSFDVSSLSPTCKDNRRGGTI